MSRSASARRRPLPLWPKLAWTAFVVVLVPLYWREYGPTNFLWFSDIALFGIVAALWRENALIASMMSLSVLILELSWIGDFLTGGRFIGLAAYMYDSSLPLWLRALSLFHLAIPPTLVWLLYRLGYDRRSLIAQTGLALVVLPATYALTDPADNINWVFGFGEDPEPLLPQPFHLAALMVGFPLLVYLPTHLLLKRIFVPSS